MPATLKIMSSKFETKKWRSPMHNPVRLANIGPTRVLLLAAAAALCMHAKGYRLSASAY